MEKTMPGEDGFRVLVVNLTQRKSELVRFGDPAELLGGSGLAAGLFARYGKADAPADDPDQPLIFAIGPLTGYFPMMSKVVMSFKSPYVGEYAETHAGGRMALALRLAGHDALVITGVGRVPCCLIIGGRAIEIKEVPYLWGLDVLTTGKHLRRVYGRDAGHRSILRIGPAGERGVAFASVNVDTYRHFGRLGGGAALGRKNLKGIIVLGDGSHPLPEGKTYRDLYAKFYQEMIQTSAMKKYHDLGTPENTLVLNGLKALPWRNLQATSDPQANGISGERFAEEVLLRKMACSGCPVGCIHVGLLREKFADQHEFLYRQVSYDHEPIFAAGSMLGITNPGGVLLLLDEMERQGLDVMSAGVALAWATEASQRGLVTEKETLVPLAFGSVDAYQQAVRFLGTRANDFYHALGQGTGAAARRYGGEEFACVLGQEMAGYATGEVFFVSQAYGFRYSHLDSAGYGLDQKPHDKEINAAVTYLIEEERRRVALTCMVSCLFARNVYTDERLQEALSAVGYSRVAESFLSQSKVVQARRWQLKFRTGYNPDTITIPRRFREIQNWRGAVDESFMDELSGEYVNAVRGLASGLSQPEAR